MIELLTSNVLVGIGAASKDCLSGSGNVLAKEYELDESPRLEKSSLPRGFSGSAAEDHRSSVPAETTVAIADLAAISALALKVVDAVLDIADGSVVDTTALDAVAGLEGRRSKGIAGEGEHGNEEGGGHHFGGLRVGLKR